MDWCLLFFYFRIILMNFFLRIGKVQTADASGCKYLSTIKARCCLLHEETTWHLLITFQEGFVFSEC